MNPYSVDGYAPGMVALRNGVLGNSILRCLDSTTRPANAPRVESSRLWYDELDNCTDEADACPCSTSLARRESRKEPFQERRLPGSPEASGSLIPSPEGDSPTCAPACGSSSNSAETLDQETHDLIETFFADYAGLCTTLPRQNEALATMKRVVANVVEKHQFIYNGMIGKLGLDQKSDDMIIIRTVAQQLFSDGTTNWGRIVSLVAFGAEVCSYLKKTGRGHCIKAVGYQISSYLLSEHRLWLYNNKAWDGFVEFFHVEDTESLVRSMLFAFASVAGIGAGLALLIR
ncbi:induced myeloid leukemia cell differentiation protein Mcl-1b [Brienomyrus brachyistius]|uniref:induced myeloid leukemia cell differentiation protein Mcl-1b n=1 Tax=Brienomyrus brachyistius TaxID=42636 RepID=UPI0020B2F0A7|nr:induced myeloid leukemia cell differentiation protein Mcl-1b [Brienomyrus brachyistius]